MRASRALAICALVGGLAGCGGSAEDVLSETATKLGEIRSGDLHARLLVGTTGRGGDVGFELDGPFALPDEGGQLPVAEIDYTQIAGTESDTVTLTSTGTEAFVEVAGTPYELSREAAEDLSTSAGPSATEEELAIGDWFESPELSDGGEVGGADTDRVAGQLNVEAAVNGLLELAERLDAGGPGTVPLLRAAEESPSQAPERAEFEVYTGKEDRLLRRLRLDIRHALDEAAQEAIEASTGEAATEARIEFELEIAQPNRSVSVDPPPDAQPASALGM